MVIENAPGLKARSRKSGPPAYYWVASAISRETEDYPLKTVRVHGNEDEVAARCRVLTEELKEWLANRGRGERHFDGTIKALIRVYQTTPESSYQTVKFNTRRMYDENLKILENSVGQMRLDELNGINFKRWFNNFKAPAKDGGPERPRRAYGAMQLLRIIVGFGVVTDTPHCARLSDILKHMEFSIPKPRTAAMTFQYAQEICSKAIEEGFPSIALAQALQFELTLRQIDVIGRWEPVGEDEGGIVDRRQRWCDGLLWSHLDSKGILVKPTSKVDDVTAEHDTNAYPFLRKIIDMVPMSKRIGPMIVSEATGLPYRYRHFADTWRDIADKAGIPKGIWNRDSRAGGVTEGSDAGADLEHLRHHANHKNAQTTSRYNRKTLEKTKVVADLRTAMRERKNGQGTDL
jgi:hypothetical protein